MTAHKIFVKHPIVDLGGEDMADHIRQRVQTELIRPFIDFAKLQSFELNAKNRDETNDQVLKDAIAAIKECGCAVKTSAITPSEADCKRLGLKRHWTDLTSAAGELRGAIGGTIFRETLHCGSVVGRCGVPTKELSPIVVARFGTGGLYTATEIVVPESGNPSVYTYNKYGRNENLSEEITNAAKQSLPKDTVCSMRYRKSKSVEEFAQDVLTVALKRKLPVYVSSKSSLSATHAQFASGFKEYFNNNFRKRFLDAGLWVKYKAPDVMVATIMKSRGGFIVACQNYDGELFCPLVAEMMGGVGLMSAQTYNSREDVIMSYTEHGTIASHWNKHLANPKAEIRTNPVAIIGSWVYALTHLSKLDKNPALLSFATFLREATRETLMTGVATPDIRLDTAELKNNMGSEDLKEERVIRGTASTDEFLKVTRENLWLRLRGSIVSVKSG